MLATIEKAKPQFLNFIIDGDWKFIGYQSAQGLGVSIKHLRFLSNHSQKLVLHCNAKLQLSRTGGVQGNPAMKACSTVCATSILVIGSITVGVTGGNCHNGACTYRGAMWLSCNYYCFSCNRGNPVIIG